MLHRSPCSLPLPLPLPLASRNLMLAVSLILIFLPRDERRGATDRDLFTDSASPLDVRSLSRIVLRARCGSFPVFVLRTVQRFAVYSRAKCEIELLIQMHLAWLTRNLNLSKGLVGREERESHERKQEVAGGIGIQKQGDTRERTHESPASDHVIKIKRIVHEF